MRMATQGLSHCARAHEPTPRGAPCRGNTADHTEAPTRCPSRHRSDLTTADRGTRPQGSNGCGSEPTPEAGSSGHPPPALSLWGAPATGCGWGRQTSRAARLGAHSSTGTDRRPAHQPRSNHTDCYQKDWNETKEAAGRIRKDNFASKSVAVEGRPGREKQAGPPSSPAPRPGRSLHVCTVPHTHAHAFWAPGTWTLLRRTLAHSWVRRAGTRDGQTKPQKPKAGPAPAPRTVRGHPHALGRAGPRADRGQAPLHTRCRQPRGPAAPVESQKQAGSCRNTRKARRLRR